MLFTHSENKSLKQQFFLQTLFIGFVIIAIAIYFYASTINEKEHVFKEVQFIDAQLEKINQFKQKRIILQQSILNFLIDPIYHNQENVIYNIVDEMIQIIKEFKQNEVTKHSHDLDSDVLINKLKRFKSILEELITIRMNVELQFPAMSLSANEMTGIDDKFSSNIMIMIDEIESGSLIPKQENIYPLLLKTRTAWVSLVSQMRIYLANRLASFSTEILESQANSALSISEVLITNLDQLEQYYLEEEDSFEGLEALQQMQESVYTWLDIFSEMRIQSESRQWRQDWNFLDKNIIPEENSIFKSLSKVEKNLREEERYANSTLNRSIDKAFIFIAIVIIVGIAFLYIVLVSINKMVFTPIQAVSNALQAKAFGKEIPAFEIKPSKETQTLIEAFEEMDHQVSQRQETLEIQAEHLKEYQTELEEMVESRTIELKKSNASLKETLDELHRTQTQLIENEKMAALGGLVSGVAHEINTPIGVCVTASSTLQDTSKALKKMLDSGKIKKSSLVDFVDKTET
jgi:signal transduction histidine kinase